MAETTDRALATLRAHGDWLCDDCWFVLSRLAARQQARRIGHDVVAAGLAMRDQFAYCSKCKKSKYCTRATGPIPSGVSPVPIPRELEGPQRRCASTLDQDRVWHWEGNVQHAVVEWLRSNGWEIASTANTASKAAGVDVIARLNDRELWVTVKGFPENRPGKVTNPSTQARNWFSHALTDVIDYRGKRRDVEIAMALPGPFPTYDSWVRRVAWLMPVVPFWVFVVGCSGRVCPDRQFP